MKYFGSGLKELRGITVITVDTSGKNSSDLMLGDSDSMMLFARGKVRSERATDSVSIQDLASVDRSERAPVVMLLSGPDFIDAITAFEAVVIELNREFGATLPEPIVAAYPQDGTIAKNRRSVGHRPLFRVGGTPWGIGGMVDKPNDRRHIGCGEC